MHTYIMYPSYIDALPLYVHGYTNNLWESYVKYEAGEVGLFLLIVMDSVIQDGQVL